MDDGSILRGGRNVELQSEHVEFIMPIGHYIKNLKANSRLGAQERDVGSGVIGVPSQAGCS